jgi:hypothetical protein
MGSSFRNRLGDDEFNKFEKISDLSSSIDSAARGNGLADHSMRGLRDEKSRFSTRIVMVYSIAGISKLSPAKCGLT